MDGLKHESGTHRFPCEIPKVFKEIEISLITTGSPANFRCGSLLEPVTATLWCVPPL